MNPMRVETMSALLLALVSLLSACSTTLSVKEVEEAQKDAVLDGVPFRLPAPHELHVYESPSTDMPYQFLQTFETEMADTEKLFTVDFDSDFLADPTFSLAIAEDGTVTKLTLDSTLKGDEALGAAAEGATKVKEALLEVEARELAQQKKLQDDEKARQVDAAAQENARLAAYEAFLAAETAVGEFRAMRNDPDVTPTEKLKKRNEVWALQAKANTLYRLAGMTPPYDLHLPD